MYRSVLSFCALSLFVAACSSGAGLDATGVDLAGSLDADGTPQAERIPLSVEEETAFCTRLDTAEGGMCRVSTPSEPSPFKWTLCTQDDLAPLRPSQYYVPLCNSDVPLYFKKAKPDGTLERVVTVNRAKYVICSRNQLGVRNVPRAEVYARAGTAHVTVDAYNQATEAHSAEAVIAYDNTAYRGQAPLLEAAILFQSPKDGTWHESGRIDLPNDQTLGRVRGFAPANVNVRLEVRGSRTVTGEPVAAIIDARLSLPGVCQWDEATQTCAY